MRIQTIHRSQLDLAHQLDIVVRELAELDVVDAEFFLFARGAELQRGDVFAQQGHGEQDEGGEGEAPDGAGGAVAQLDGELDPVVVEPTALDQRHAVEVGDVFSRQETRKQVADEAADAVHGEDVERVVGADPVFDLGGEVAADAGGEAVDDGGPGGDEAGAWRDGDEAGDDARAEAHGGTICARGGSRRDTR